MLLFNRQIFYTLSDNFKYICDYPESEECVCLYLNYKTSSNIIDLGLAFALGLIKAIKKIRVRQSKNNQSMRSKSF